jgi:hypothetical protein
MSYPSEERQASQPQIGGDHGSGFVGAAHPPENLHRGRRTLVGQYRAILISAFENR